MARTTDHPKPHVVSFRVNAAEWQQLVKLSRQAGVDVSTLLRRNLRETLKDFHGYPGRDD